MLVGSVILAINFAPVPDERKCGPRARCDRGSRSPRLLHPTAARGQPALRPEHRSAPRLLGRGVRRNHRLRLADGRDVRQSAVPPERERLLHAPGRRGHPSGRPRHGRRRTPLREARRSARGKCHAPLRLRVPVLSPSSGCCSSGTKGSAYWQIATAYIFIGAGVGLAGNAGVALTHGVGAGDTRRHGLGHRRPPAVSGSAVESSRSSAPCSRQAMPRPYRGANRSRPPTRTSREVRRRRSRSPSTAPKRSRSSIRSTPTRSSPARRRHSWTATTGHTPRGWSRSCSARCWSGSCSRKSTTRRSSYWPPTTPRTAESWNDDPPSATAAALSAARTRHTRRKQLPICPKDGRCRRAALVGRLAGPGVEKSGEILREASTALKLAQRLDQSAFFVVEELHWGAVLCGERERVENHTEIVGRGVGES